MDRAWLFEKTLTEKILKMSTLLKIRGIKSSRHKLDEFVSMFFYFPGIELTNRLAYAHIYGELYIVKRLKANLLMSNDILAIERVIINLANKFARISICQVTISVAAKPKSHPVQRKVLVNRSLMIYPESETLVQFVCSSFPDNQDFLFNATPHSHLTLFSHILNDLTYKVLVRNTLQQLVLLPRHQRFGTLTEVLYDNCFQVSLDFELAKYPPTTLNYQTGIRVPIFKPGFETCLVNGIRVYRKSLAV